MINDDDDDDDDDVDEDDNDDDGDVEALRVWSCKNCLIFKFPSVELIFIQSCYAFLARYCTILRSASDSSYFHGTVSSR